MLDRHADSYAVVAIKFAHREQATRPEHFYRGHVEPPTSMPISYYVWLVLGRGRAILVDTGYTEDVSESRGGREYLQSPTTTLEALGVAAADIDTVVITHMHYDHVGRLGEFANANVVLQQSEYEYWTGPYGARGESGHLTEEQDLALITSLVAAGRVELVNGDSPIAEGVAVHHLGGHTAGMQVVSVDVARGRTLVLASDASHFYENIESDRPFSIVDHVPSMHAAFDWVLGAVGDDGIVVPGHDPAVMQRYPAIPGFEGLAVQIA